MDDNEYLELVAAYKKWVSLPYYAHEPLDEKNRLRAAAWEDYVVKRDAYYKGAKLTPPPYEENLLH